MEYLSGVVSNFEVAKALAQFIIKYNDVKRKLMIGLADL